MKIVLLLAACLAAGTAISLAVPVPVNLHADSSSIVKDDLDMLDELKAFVESAIAADPSLAFDDEFSLQSRIESAAVSKESFPCNVSALNSVRMGAKASSVHELTPADINVVAAMGDSITAAFAAQSHILPTIFIEWREVSWSIGGAKHFEDYITIPNIIKKFNPNVYGYSTGPNIAKNAGKAAGLNVAVSGAIAKDMPSQASTLIEKLKNDPKVDFENDWKLLTLWIGGNDLCAYCKSGDDHTPENYAKYIEQALDSLLEVPRLFVNLVEIIDVTKLYPVHNGLCDTLHSIECKCGTVEGEAARKDAQAAAVKYQQLVSQLAQQDKYNARNDWTVVAQPFYEQTELPKDSKGKPDRSYFAPDCFHYKQKTHRDAAVALWNSMLEPVGSKRLSWVPGELIECPSAEQPFLATNKNSVSN